VPKTWILYGASGEIGQFISTHAVALGLQPILAGRDAERVARQAERLGLDYRVAALDDPDEIDAVLSDADLVLNCAGPFIDTAMPMVDACLRTRTHYLDLSAEFLTLQDVLDRDEEALEQGVLLLPGSGFDVIATDCVALRLHEALPSGDRLELGIGSGLHPTRGVVASMLEILAAGPIIRRNGDLVRLSEPSTRTIVLNRRPTTCVSIAWGDLVTAHHSTGIPNISVYVQTLEHRGAPITDLARLAEILRASLSTDPPRAHVGGRIGVWGKVVNQQGERAEAILDLPDNHAFTATASCEIVCRILEDQVPQQAGATTPSRLFGSQFVLDLPGVGGFGLRRETRA
jgi:short subunit dehydrogenase-like uncharacterized protein